jgi:2,3-bisphosphoglycerate-independent phosphoglycerate mutase
MSKSPTHCILLLLDGLGDRSYTELGNRTPLQAAHTPNLDKLAARGGSGLMHCADQGMALPSENAHFAMFGYRPEEFPGRGYLEALGAGIEIDEGETAFLAHLSMLKPQGSSLLLVKDRPKLSRHEVAPLFEAVREFSYDDLHFRLVPTKGVDAILVLSAPSSKHVTDTLPFFDNSSLIEPQPLAGFKDDPVAEKTATALKAFLVWCHKTLSSHSLNISRQQEGKGALNGIVTLRPGQHLTVENFNSRWGLKGASLASGLVYWGLSQYLGLQHIEVKDSEDPGRDIHDRILQAIDLKNDYDFIHVHTKAPDEAAHTKNCQNKVAAIESLDRGIGRAIDALLEKDTLLIITADHSTPSSGPLIHSGEPVPITMVGTGVRQDNIQKYNEIDCGGGSLGYIHGHSMMYMVLNGLDRVKLAGLQDTPVDQPFWPGHRTSFKLE